MKCYLGVEGEFYCGIETLIESISVVNHYSTVFEDDKETGYFYAVDSCQEQPILDALHIYNVSNVTDRDKLNKAQIVWSEDGLKSALVINGFIHAVFDFDGNRGFCRTGFPPLTNWSKEGHEWDEKAIKLFD